MLLSPPRDDAELERVERVDAHVEVLDEELAPARLGDEARVDADARHGVFVTASVAGGANQREDPFDATVLLGEIEPRGRRQFGDEHAARGEHAGELPRQALERVVVGGVGQRAEERDDRVETRVAEGERLPEIPSHERNRAEALRAQREHRRRHVEADRAMPRVEERRKRATGADAQIEHPRRRPELGDDGAHSCPRDARFEAVDAIVARRDGIEESLRVAFVPHESARA